MAIYSILSDVKEWWKQSLPYLSDFSLQDRELQLTINSDRQRELFARYQTFAEDKIAALRIIKALVGLIGLVFSAQWVITGFPVSVTSIVKGFIVILILLFSATGFVDIRAVAVAGFPGFRKTGTGIFEILLPCLQCESGTVYAPAIDENPPKYCANCDGELSVDLLSDDQILEQMMEKLDRGEKVKLQIGLYNSSATEAFVEYPGGDIHPIVDADNIEIKQAGVAGDEIIIELTVSDETLESIQETKLSLDIVLAQDDEEWNVGIVDADRGLIGTIGPKDEYDEFIERIIDTGLFHLALYSESGNIEAQHTITLSEIDLGKLRQLRNHSEYA